MQSNFNFRKANTDDADSIWKILQSAIARRKADGSNQWQDGYPNPDVIANDLRKEAGFVLTDQNRVIGYVAIMINDEPEYARLKGKWLSEGDFVVFHRVAISDEYLGRGLAQRLFDHIEEFTKANKINSIKADTNFDNEAMLRIFDKMGYVYCGEVTFRGSSRKAFEKLL